MFAVVRTGGKQYRVAAGDKIVVEKLAGEAGDTVTLGDVLLAGEGGDLKPTDGLTVSAEIIAQAKADKVTVFKKRRRHNYRRKRGHRQQHTILRITAIGDRKAEKPKKAVKTGQPAAEAAPAAAEAPAKKAKPKKAETPATEAKPKPQAPLKVEGAESEMTDSPKPARKKASPKKPAADKNA
ncbi:50S ribosomal protein L21 [Allosphingosinicella sp.]|jgi:large subunit ribosomal protein L21|uniref:50S ribosomal protein L21 n=1 Tax=Allosphingosinicella sp. TaxID=2823234 RepID=UPI002F0A220F